MLYGEGLNKDTTPYLFFSVPPITRTLYTIPPICLFIDVLLHSLSLQLLCISFSFHLAPSHPEA